MINENNCITYYLNSVAYEHEESYIPNNSPKDFLLEFTPLERKEHAQLKYPSNNMYHCNKSRTCKVPVVLQWVQTKEEYLEKTSNWSETSFYWAATSPSWALVTSQIHDNFLSLIV